MGAGVAKQAAMLYPNLAGWYGEYCREMAKTGKTGLKLFKEGRLIMFPVKPLNKACPYVSWKYTADVTLIEVSLGQLSRFDDPVALPLVGCGNGKLSPGEVLPLIWKYLFADNFVLVLREAEIAARARRGAGARSLRPRVL